MSLELVGALNAIAGTTGLEGAAAAAAALERFDALETSAAAQAKFALEASLREADGRETDDVMASWWSEPRAMGLNATYWDRTMFGGITRGGEQVVGSFDHRRPRVRKFPIGAVRSGNGAQHLGDDHNTPAILAMVDRLPIVAYTGHGLDRYVRVRRGKAIGAVEQWDAAETLVDFGVGNTCTYAQLISHRRNNSDEKLLLTRVNSRYWYLSRSVNAGLAWAAPFALFDFGLRDDAVTPNSGYLTHHKCYDMDDNYDIRILLAGHPVNSDVRHLWECYARANTGEIKVPTSSSAVGDYNPATSLPLTVSALHKAYDTPADRSMRLLSVGGNSALSAATNAEAVIVTWVTADLSDCKYVYGKRTGTNWVWRDITATGEPFGYHPETKYVGGASLLNPSTGGKLFLSREEAGEWIIELWETADAGLTWATTEIDRSPTADGMLVRPDAVINPTGIDVVYKRLYTYGDGVPDEAYTKYAADLIAAAV